MGTVNDLINLILTMYNKIVLANNFPFPYILTAIHCFFVTAGSLICLKAGVFTRAQLTQSDAVIVIGLYTFNIVVSNVSLYISCGRGLIVGMSS